MGLFSAVSTANPNSGGVYFLPGNYLVEIMAIKAICSRKNENMYVIEAHIIESDNSERRPGTQASQVISMKHESAPGNIRGFLAAAMNTDYKEIGEDEAEASFSDVQPLKGTRMQLICVNVKTREGRDYTKHAWSFVAAPSLAARTAADSRIAATANAASTVGAVRPPPPAVGPLPSPAAPYPYAPPYAAAPPPPPAVGPTDWQAHPSDPRALWSPSTGQTRWA